MKRSIKPAPVHVDTINANMKSDTRPADLKRDTRYETRKTPLSSPAEKAKFTWILVATIVLFTIATAFTRFNPLSVLRESNVFIRFFTEDFLPPSISKAGELAESILVTLALAFSTTFISSILAAFMAFMGSVATAPSAILAKVIRGVASFLRNIPALVWAFILFMSLGIGTSVGFVALLISTFAFLLRAFIETIDETSGDVIEALSASGASFWQRIVHAVLPSSVSGMIAWILYSIEVNIRASTIVGMVGGGGIGLVLLSYIKSFRYNIAFGIMLVIAAMIILVDLLTNILRKKVLV